MENKVQYRMCDRKYHSKAFTPYLRYLQAKIRKMKLLKIYFKETVKKLLASILYLWFSLKRKQKFNPKDTKQIKEIKSILFIFFKPLGIGDMLMDTPAFKEVRKKYPTAKITLLTDRSFVKGNNSFDEIILTKSSLYSIMASSFKQKKQDLVILLNKNLIQSFVALLIKKRFLIGYIYDWKVRANFTLKYSVEYKPSMHYYEMPFNVIKNLNINSHSWDMDPLVYSKKLSDKIEKMISLGKSSRIITINPFVLWKSRAWPKKNYIALIEKLIKDKKNHIVITGGPGDELYNKAFDNKFSRYNNFIDLTGELSLTELAALFSVSDLVITGDCGPMHIAISEKANLLTLWGVTDPLTRLPKKYINKNIHYIYKRKSKISYNLEHEPLGDKAIEAITVEEVYKKTASMLKKVK